jgi:hypothetical protein
MQVSRRTCSCRARVCHPCSTRARRAVTGCGWRLTSRAQLWRTPSQVCLRSPVSPVSLPLSFFSVSMVRPWLHTHRAHTGVQTRRSVPGVAGSTLFSIVVSTLRSWLAGHTHPASPQVDPDDEILVKATDEERAATSQVNRHHHQPLPTPTRAHARCPPRATDTVA